MTTHPEDVATMDEISQRIVVLNESLRLFLQAFRERAGTASYADTQKRLDELCKVIVSLGGTIPPAIAP